MAAKAPVKKNLSAIKKARQSEKRNERNRTLRTKIRNIIKAAESTAAGDNKEETAKALRQAEKVISSAASKGILHKNNASRKISRLTKRVNVSGKAAAV